MQNFIEKLEKLLENQRIQQKEILSFKEAQEYLNVSKSFLYKLTSKGDITYFKPNGKLIYFKKSDLDEWMLQNESKEIEILECELANYLSR